VPSNDKTVEKPLEELDERAIARKYGLRELVYPDSSQIKALTSFLGGAVESGRCGPVPKTAIVVMLDYLQGTMNRQHITKGPRMSQEEFDVLQTPYYLAARIMAKLAREKKGADTTKAHLYESTYNALNQFIDVLRSLLDPGCYWFRLKTVPEGVRDVMEVLWDFALIYPEQRRKGRAM
jgi:hypothetical protein